MSAKMFNPYLSVFGSFLVVVFANVCTNSSSIRNVELIAKPRRVKVGEPIQLYCNYDLDGVGLHSVKFYHKQKEFFRYTPADNRSSQEFPSSNFEIKQKGISIEIKPLDVDASGIYECEVATDAPAFETAIVQQNIVVIPSEPEISPERPLVQLKITPPRPVVGKPVKLQCFYNVGYDEVGSIRIIKDDQEIYRHCPNLGVPSTFYGWVLGVNADIDSSSKTSVVLPSVTLNSSGIYKCEVTTEPPNARTLTVEKNLTIQPQQSETESATAKLPFVELKITPTRPVEGESVKLEWAYDVGSEIVYSIKIYKDGLELYRYLPNDVMILFPVPAVTVEPSSASNTSIELFSVTSMASGVYACEISTEAPFFTVVRTEKLIEIE